ncbi:MAG: ATP-binding protein [Bacteroidota bacterium]
MSRKKLYFYAVLAAISLILMNQAFIQYWLFQKKEDASTINIAGRQRMLSQKLVKLAYELEGPAAAETRERAQQLYQEWESAHHTLLQRHTDQIFLFSGEIVIRKKIEALQPYLDNCLAYLKIIYTGDQSVFPQFLENQDQFLAEMEILVADFQRASDFKLNLVITIEIIFALLSLALICYEIVFIFKKVIEDLAQKNEALTNSNLLLEQYAYLASHDLRTPTQNIINFSRLLKNRLAPKMEEEEALYCQYITSSALRLKDTTDDLLAFSSINQQKLEISTFELEKLVREIWEEMRPDWEKKSAEFVIEALPDTIKGDRILIGLVIQNLLDNAMKYVATDRKPLIRISCTTDHQYHRVKVEDNGLGIEAAHQEQIFGLFKRLHTYESYPGTGLGLSLCEKILEKHGGQIGVESIVGQGSTFFFRLPLAPLTPQRVM